MRKTKIPKIIVLVGPTASGKSDLAIRLAKLAPSFTKVLASKQDKLFQKKWEVGGAEIISADSRQVYLGMDIGTGKVKRDNIKYRVLSIEGKKKNSEYYSEGIRHYLIDIASPKKQFTAEKFKKLGEKSIKEIIFKNKIPIIVGGTGFYIDVLLGRIKIAEIPPNKRLRALFDKPFGRELEAELLAIEHLFKMLKKLDPQRAKTIDRHNKRRLIRALEIFLATNKTSLQKKQTINNKKYEILWLGLNPDKKELAGKIKKRIDMRLQQGMIEEVENLHKNGLSWKRMNELGLEYRQIAEYLKNLKLIAGNKKYKSKIKNFENSEYYQVLLKKIIKYSKRQMTWFKRNKEIHWLKNQKEAEWLISRFLKS